ncbi:hypothetical protein [Streptomyces sp. NPDC058755]|uniref:hypothetical protein n=1 Tax=Streptomyces sp. NPDC058755 TaxID=3346624 RepID=UPI0036D20377
MTIRDATLSDSDDIYRLLSGFVTSYAPDWAVFGDVPRDRRLSGPPHTGQQRLSPD